MSVGPSSAKIVALGLAMPLLVGAPSKPVQQRAEAVQLHAADWLEFDTGACGQVDKLKGSRSRHVVTRTMAPIDGDDDDWTNAWNMSPEQSVVLNDWLLDHPDVATITEAIEKSCDEDRPMDDPDDLDIA